MNDLISANLEPDVCGHNFVEIIKMMPLEGVSQELGPKSIFKPYVACFDCKSTLDDSFMAEFHWDYYVELIWVKGDER